MQTPIRIGELLIDPTPHQVTLAGALLQLTPTEYRLLSVLAARPEQVVPRDTLAKLVWGDPDTGTSRTIDVHIGRLRVKLSQGGARAPQIVSVRGFGYKIMSPGGGYPPTSLHADGRSPPPPPAHRNERCRTHVSRGTLGPYAPWRCVEPMPRAAQHLANGSLLLALGVALVVGVLLGRSSFVSAQSLGQGTDPTFFPATGYRISSPAIYDYFQSRGGVRTFGLPVSNDFPLLGHRIQIFQRQVLELRQDGSVTAVNVLEPDVLPIQNIDGLSLPAVDLELLANSPATGSPDYAEQGLAFVNAYVPDEWEGMQVNYLSTFLNTVSCADAFEADPAACDESLLPVYALEIWGLPTSLPTPDPVNPEFVYQRFQRGILHYSRATGLTQGLLVGDWFKRVLIGLNLSPDIGADVRASRFFGQYAPNRPLGLSRPTDLPDTSLAQAFRSETLSTAAQQGATLPPVVAQTATSVAMTATALTGTQVVLESTAISLTSTAISLIMTPTTPGVLTPGVLTPGTTLMPTPSPIGLVSDIPVSTAGCMGDEQMWFVPRRPSIGTRMEISVTSQRRHDLHVVRLAGPVDSGTPTERLSRLRLHLDLERGPGRRGLLQLDLLTPMACGRASPAASTRSRHWARPLRRHPPASQRTRPDPPRPRPRRCRRCRSCRASTQAPGTADSRCRSSAATSGTRCLT